MYEGYLPHMPADFSMDTDVPLQDPQALLRDLTASLQQTAEEITPWFTQNMPQSYFQDTAHEEQLAHLRVIIAARASGQPIHLTLPSACGTRITIMRPKDYPGVLAELLEELPHHQPLRAAKIHTANDGSLVIDSFEFGDTVPNDPDGSEHSGALTEVLAYARESDSPHSEEEIMRHFHRCSGEYLTTITPLRFCKHLNMFMAVSGTDGTTVALESETDPTLSRIVVAVTNASTRRMIERIAKQLAHVDVNIHHAYLDMIDDPPHGTITLLGFIVQAPGGVPIDPDSRLWHELREDLLRNKWVDSRSLAFSYRHEPINSVRGEIISCFCDLSHQILVKENKYVFTLDRIHHMAGRNIDECLMITELFRARFDPSHPLSDADFTARCDELTEHVQHAVDLEDERLLLHHMIRIVRSTLRTNLFLEDRFALGLRLDPSLLENEERKELPYGIFFVHGRGFNGFHVRFRDIARGGLRVVKTHSEEQHALEAERLYDEVYNLAHAQQLKNKDIPEGGAKAIILASPYARHERIIKGFVDALLDLITPGDDGRGALVDFFEPQEMLYLGPDENLLPEHIEWITQRAARRGYPHANAFMSSKATAGINHKQYGVTSEGVTVFLDVALRAAGINPDRDTFSVTLTGGPDGDVGGNLIRILHREYADRVKILGIADGSGSGEDPAGLDMTELTELVDREEPIASFDHAKLGPQGRIVSIDEPDGVSLRNSLHNRIRSDAFLPCGGRPSTIHERNWKDFLCKDGTPSSRIIIEGANLFLTPGARDLLSDAGVMIFKDSSANKCGVITSSYEVMSSILLSEEDFLDIKDTFIEQVLEKLRFLARREADLLTRINHHHPDISLPTLSIRLSHVMMRTADAIAESIDALKEEHSEILRQLVIDHIPHILIEKAGDRIWTDIPRPYLDWIMAKTLAARIMYREGMNYMEKMPEEGIAEFSMDYLVRDLERSQLAEAIEDSTLEYRERIAALLRQAGICSTLD